MLLTLDLGNSRIKYAFFESENIIEHGAVSPDNFAPCFLALKKKYAKVSQWQIVLGSVVDLVSQKVSDFFVNEWGIKPLIWSATMEVFFPVTIQNPQTIGVDRLANIAAIAKNLQNTLVIDMGTFLTIDCYLLTQGFIGGIIFPGISTTQNVYAEKSAKLKPFAIKPEKNCFGNDTESAMRVGLFQSYLHLLRGFITDFKKLDSGLWQVVATGGGWPILQHEFLDVHSDPLLTLKGLMALGLFAKKQGFA